MMGDVERDKTCTRKVKAHAEEKVLRGEMRIEDFLRNSLADATADAMAARMVEGLHCQEVEKWQAICGSIAWRLAIIESEIEAERLKEE